MRLKCQNKTELRDQTMGVDQVRQAKSYSKEPQTETGICEIFVNREQDGFLKSQIRSRHTSSKAYNLWIEHSTSSNPTTGWFCTCKSVARVVGCYAHIASVLWYLGFEWHQPPTKNFKAHDIYKVSFRPPLVTSFESDAVIAKRMMALAKSPNKLQKKVGHTPEVWNSINSLSDESDIA